MSNVSNPAFKGIYKVNVPDVKNIKNDNEKNAVAETMINTLILGANYSVADPRAAKDNSAVYFKIDDKNDKVFESGFKSVIDQCNKQFNMDMAKSIYLKKVDEKEFNTAEILK